MKKVTVILSMFVFAFCAQSFAQSTIRPATLTLRKAGASEKENKNNATKVAPLAPKPDPIKNKVAVPAPKPSLLLLPTVQKVREGAPRKH